MVALCIIGVDAVSFARIGTIMDYSLSQRPSHANLRNVHFFQFICFRSLFKSLYEILYNIFFLLVLSIVKPLKVLLNKQ